MKEDTTDLPVFMDFGLAKRFGDVAEGATKLTHAGTLHGTPSYRSPEQVRGKVEDIGSATDVYSHGIVLFVLRVETPTSSVEATLCR